MGRKTVESLFTILEAESDTDEEKRQPGPPPDAVGSLFDVIDDLAGDTGNGDKRAPHGRRRRRPRPRRGPGRGCR